MEKNSNSKIILITGASSGIGKATTLELARQGAQIIMVCRNKEKGEVVRQEIIKESSNSNISLELCDLSSHASIKVCTAQLRSNYSHIDVLINNAGGIFGAHGLTVDGLEQSFGLNHMGYFLFTHYVLDLVKAGKEKRIVNVASMAHKMAKKVPWGDLQLRNIKYGQFAAYAWSKLYNVYFTRSLAEKLKTENTNITVNCLHPGTVYTGFGNSGTDFFQKLFKVGGPLLASPKNGSKTSVYLAVSPKVKDITGRYFAHKRKAWASKQSKNMDDAQRLWDKSMELSDLDTYGVVDGSI